MPPTALWVFNVTNPGDMSPLSVFEVDERGVVYLLDINRGLDILEVNL